MNNFIRNRKKQFLYLGCILFLAGTTFFFLSKDQDLPKLLSVLQKADISFLMLGFFAMLLFFSFEAAGLRLLFGSLGYQAGFSRCLRYSFIDFYFSSITPGCCGGQPSQIFYMHRDGIPPGVSSLVLLLFNLAYHAAVLIIAFSSIALGGVRLLTALGSVRYLLIFGICAQLLLIMVFFTAVFSKKLLPSCANCMIGLFSKTSLLKNQAAVSEKIHSQIGEYQQGAGYIRSHPGLLCKGILLALLHLISLYSVSFWVYRALGLSHFNLITLIAMQSVLTLSVESLPIPGGMGITESCFLVLYGSIFGGGLVIPALLLCRGLNYYVFLLVGGAASALPGRPLSPSVKALSRRSSVSPGKNAAKSARSHAVSGI